MPSWKAKAYIAMSFLSGLLGGALGAYCAIRGLRG